MSRVIVTGANGFVGRALCQLLVSSGHEVVGTSRSAADDRHADGINLVATGDIGADLDWRPVLEGADSVVHLAARVHVMREQAADPLSAFRKTNVDGTEKLIHASGVQGVKRFVYLSTIKVCGDRTAEEPFSATGSSAPEDAYARSKFEAERLVGNLGAELGVETVIIRPPLVYGPEVGGNFLRLLRLVQNGVPLPFAAIDNRRSLVGVSNLCDLVRECLDNPSASGQTFLVSDNNDLSTPGLIRHLAAAMEKRSRLFPLPPGGLRLVARLFGRSEEVSRLIDSLQVDMRRTMNVLGWSPPVSVSDEIHSTVNWYLEQSRHVGH